MTEKLRTALAEVADEARSYPDADRTIALMRRRRARRLAVATPVVVATLVAGVFFGGQILRQQPGDGFPAQVAAAPAVAYPPTVRPPAVPRTLPDTAVGAASFLYAPCARECGYLLVLADGTQFAISADGHAAPQQHFSLSSTGRWLAENTAEGMRFRDLTSRATREVADSGPGGSDVWGWSPDGSWALVVRHTDGAVHHFQTVRVEDGVTRKVASDVVPKAVTDGGAVLYWATTRERGAELVEADIVEGDLRTRWRRDYDLTGSLRDTEVPNFDTWEPGRDGAVSLLTVQQPTPENDLGTPSAALLLGTAPGDTRVDRVNLPRAENPNAEDFWSPHLLEGDDVVAVNSRRDETRIVAVDSTTNAMSTLSTLPADSLVVLRGDVS